MTAKIWDTKDFWKRIEKDLDLTYFICLSGWAIACLLFSKPINLIAGKLGGFLFWGDNNSLQIYLGVIAVSYVLYLFARVVFFGRFMWGQFPVAKSMIPIAIWYFINVHEWVNPTVSFVEFPFFKSLNFLSLTYLFCIIDLPFMVVYYLIKVETLPNEKSSFITDIAHDPKENKQKDLLGFKPFAERIVAEIKTVSSPESVVFGINGEWGEGKTSMINLIRQQLEKENYTVVDFHPWKTNSGKAMNQLFFDALKDGLKNKIIGIGINWKIDRYAEALLQLDKTGLGKMVWQLLASSDSVEEQKKKLGESMKLLDKNLVVVVDDLDRLSKNEIADVLKIMRDTANFPNLVFLAAYDRKYLEEAIQTEINKHNYQNYMDKIVLWEAPIYRPQPRKYINVLKELLEHKTNVFPKDEIHDLFDLFDGTGKQKKERYSNPYEIHYALFTNLRDVKRFVGFLLFNYKTAIEIKEDVVVERKVRFRDFYYLYLLRFFFSDYYERFHIAYHELFTDKNEGKIETSFELLENYWKIIFPDKDKDPNEENIKSLITILIGFGNSQAPATSIVWYKNFPNYFYLGNHQDITMDIFSAKLKAENFDEFKNKVEILIEDKETLGQFSFGEILSAVRINLGRNHEIKDFLSDYFQHLIWISSKINPPSSFRLVFNEISTSIPKVSSTFKEQDIEIIQHNMLNFIQKSNLDEIIQPLLALLIHKCKEDGSWERSWGHEVFFNTFLNIHEAISISKNNFINHVKEGTGISIKTVSLFYCCYQKIDENGKIVWDDEVIKPMRKLADQFPDDILPYLIATDKPYINSEKKKPTWNRFLLAIFQTKEGVEKYLSESNFKKEKMRAKIYSNYTESITMIGEEIPIDFDLYLEPKSNGDQTCFSESLQIDELRIGFK